MESPGWPIRAWAVCGVIVPELCVSQLAGHPRFKASHHLVNTLGCPHKGGVFA